MRLAIPDPSLVVLVGASGSGKSTFARRHFADAEIVSSDDCRARVANDPADQAATQDAFDLLHLIVSRRLARNLLTVVDATNVEDFAREALVGLSRRHHVRAAAIVLDLGEEECLKRAAARADRVVPPEIVRRQAAGLERALPTLAEEGFAVVHVLSSPAEVDAAIVVREPLACDRRHQAGPFDIVGDVHGCLDELVELLGRLGWEGLGAGDTPRHPAGRHLISLGDLVDRGPDVAGVLRLVMRMQDAGCATWLMGNHEAKLQRALAGRDVKVTHGLAQSLQSLKDAGDEFTREVAGRLAGLPEHLLLDGGRLVVAHAGMKEGLQGRVGKAVRSFALYGETTGETDDYGLPVRYPWANDYRGDAVVVYGHTPVTEAEWIHETICLDTGCVFGGKLSALRWPERELVQVPARRTWYEPIRPLGPRA